jgi:transcriptional regulator with XRE-family HTH domain
MKRFTAMQTFILNVERIRKERGITQTELAESLGTKQPSISRVLRGEEDITLTRAEAWAAALGVSLADLVLQIEFAK